MVEKGAGLYLEDSDTNPEILQDMILSLVQDKEKLDDIRANALKLAKFDGVEKIVEQIRSSI